MNDTPRTDAAEKHAYEFKDEYTPVCESKLVRKLERELNAANVENERLKSKLSESEQLLFDSIGRIMLLVDAGDAMMSEPCEYTFEQWIKAKEAKP